MKFIVLQLAVSMVALVQLASSAGTTATYTYVTKQNSILSS